VMPRNMSFFHTQKQVRNRTKDVTRRKGWKNLKPGDLFWAIEKGQGLKKGEKVKRLALLRCVSNYPSTLYAITKSDVRREGFPEMTPIQFTRMFCEHMGGAVDQQVNRIEFEYVDQEPTHTEEP